MIHITQDAGETHFCTALVANFLLAELALVTVARPEPEPGLHAKKADLASLHILLESPVKRQAFHLSLGQNGSDVNHLIQGQVQSLQCFRPSILQNRIQML